MKQKKCTCIIVGFIIVLLFSLNYTVFGDTTFSHRDTITPGTEIKIPDRIKQYPAQVESYGTIDISKQPGRSTGTAQYDVRQLLWETQNRPVADNNIAYVEVAGQKRYVVALATTFGWSGDYVDIELSDGTVIPCIIGDSKSEHTDTPYYDEETNIFYGHKYGDKCDIVEFIMGIDGGGSNYPNAPSKFLNRFDKVKSIKNGGSYFLHEDGPVGLKKDKYEAITHGFYAPASNSNGISSNNKNDDDEQSFSLKRLLGRVIRNGWIAVATFFETDRTGINVSSIMISLYDN